MKAQPAGQQHATKFKGRRKSEITIYKSYSSKDKRSKPLWGTEKGFKCKIRYIRFKETSQGIFLSKVVFKETLCSRCCRRRGDRQMVRLLITDSGTITKIRYCNSLSKIKQCLREIKAHWPMYFKLRTNLSICLSKGRGPRWSLIIR